MASFVGISFGGIVAKLGEPISYLKTNVVEAKEIEILTDTIQKQREIVLLEIDWTKEAIEKKIRETFPEDPETAIKIAKCESGLVADIQSHHTLSYGREESFGIFQIHARAWDKKAKELGFWEYKSDVMDNLNMARFIYDSAGKRWSPWSCFTKKMI